MSPASPRRPTRRAGGSQWWSSARRALIGGFFLLVAWLLFEQAREIEWAQVGTALRGYGWPTLALAGLLAAGSHAVYGSFDLIGKRWSGHHLPARQVVPVTFVCYAFNLNLGSLVGGFAFRYRLYARLGLGNETITRVLAASLVTNWLGYLVLAGGVFALGWVMPPEGWKIGGTALRLLGMALVVVSVLLAARIGRLVGGSALTCAAVAGLFLTTPLFGALEVNGEQVAMPFVLGGVVLALQASRTPSARRRAVLLLGTGAVGAAAVLVKQNEIDVAVLALVGGLTFLRGEQRHAPWRTWALVLLGALATTAVVLGDAVRRGTDLVALFHAVVTFRLDAAAVISASAPSTNTERFWGVLAALLGSGAPVLVVMLVALGLRSRGRSATPLARLGWTTGALLAWESTSVLAGGSYWLHYLLCLVPGLVLSAAIVTTSRVPAMRLRGARLPATRLLLAFATVSCVASLAAIHQRPDLTGHETSPVIAWLDAHKRPGDTAVVAFGRPDYLVETGLRSPYSELWSLPVRVRDPDLVGFSRVLASPRRPTWIITNGAGTLGSWGIDDHRAEPLFTQHYRRAVDLGDREIYVRRSRAASLPQ